MKLIKSLENCNWKGFEQAVSEILELHNFASFWNVNITIGGLRRQFDIIANSNNETLLVECKKWSNKKSKVSALKNAVLEHKKRTELYKNLFNKKATPVLITYNEEPIIFHEGVYIVPLARLNDFLLNLF